MLLQISALSVSVLVVNIFPGSGLLSEFDNALCLFVLVFTSGKYQNLYVKVVTIFIKNLGICLPSLISGDAHYSLKISSW